MLCNRFSYRMALRKRSAAFLVSVFRCGSAGPHHKLTKLISGCLSTTVCQERPRGDHRGSIQCKRQPCSGLRGRPLAIFPATPICRRGCHKRPRSYRPAAGSHIRRPFPARSTWPRLALPFRCQRWPHDRHGRGGLEPHRFASNIGRTGLITCPIPCLR
jgi:hypothetical protein